MLWLVPTAYGLGTSKKPTHIMTRAHGLGLGTSKKLNAFYDQCPRPMAWTQVMTYLNYCFMVYR